VTVLRSGRPPTSAGSAPSTRICRSRLPISSPWPTAWVGHVGGEVAARVAVETLEQAFTREPTDDGLREAFSEANRRLAGEPGPTRPAGHGHHAHGRGAGGRGRGPRRAGLANVGDSRAYVFSEGQITQVTADHSLAEERMRHGEMTEEEAAVHPQRHILTRALGVSPRWKPTCGNCSSARVTAWCCAATVFPTSSAWTRWPGCWRRPDPGRRRASWSTRPTTRWLGQHHGGRGRRAGGGGGHHAGLGGQADRCAGRTSAHRRAPTQLAETVSPASATSASAVDPVTEMVAAQPRTGEVPKSPGETCWHPVPNWDLVSTPPA
jgi:hypothetical protein